MLKILVLGPPAILDDDKPLKIQRRQARTLLFYLACQPDGVSRGDVVSRLWKEVNETDGRRNLREVLSKLRNEIPDPEAIHSDQDRIWLDPERAYSDLYVFMALIQPVQSYFGIAQKQNALPENIVERLEQAVAIWRSPVFLAGMGIRSTNSFDDWLQSKSNSLDFFRLQSLERLADHFASTGDLDKAILYLNKALESDPLDEHLQGYLLALYYKADRFDDAQNYYRFLKELYQRELEELPPEILKLALSETQRPGLEIPPESTSRRFTVQNDTSRFIGRSKELELMEDHYSKGGVVIVIGEVGAGKTRFVRHFCSSLKEKPKTYYISCHEDETNQPLQPVINLLREYFVRKDFEKLDTYWQNSLSILVPGLIQKSSSQPSPDDFPPLESRQDLFEALYRLLVLNSHGQRSIFVLDDIQWIDPDTLLAFMYLFKEGFFQNYGFLVLISRIEIDNPRIRYMLESPKEHPTIPRIDINPFSLNETGLMSEQILGWEPGQEFVQKLYRSTGGNPLLIHETLHSILESVDDRSAIDENNIRFFDNLTTIIEEKEEILDATSKEILSAAAICGMDFQYDILDYLNICSKEVLVEVLEDLEAKQFIHSQKGLETPGKYSFNHSFFRDSLVTRVSPARQCFLNEKIALAKIKLRGSQTKRQASIIARHFEIAGKPIMAFQYWIKAAQYARELYSKEEASNAFSRANQIRLDHVQSITEEDLYTLYSEWGDMAYNLMDLPSLSECFTNMYEAGLQINSQLLLGVGLSGMGLSNLYKSEIERALVFLEEGIQIINKTDNQLEKIRCRYWFAMTLSIAGFNVRAIEILNEANILGEALNNQKIREIVTLVQDFSSLLCSTLGLLSQAVEYGKAALRNSYLLVSKHSAHPGAFTTLAIAEYYSGRFFESMKYIKQSKKILLTHRNPRILAYISLVESRLNTLQARLDSGWDLAIAAMQLATDNKYLEIISGAYCARGDVFLTLHMYDKAINEYKLGFDIIPGAHSGLDNYYRFGYATAMNGDLEAGLQILKSAIDQAEKIQLGSIFIPARYLYAQLLESNGQFDEAKGIFENVIDEAQSRGFSLITIPGSLPRLRYLWDTLENSLAEQVISNLYSKGVIQPGVWIERLIANARKNQLYSEQFDHERFFRFLRAPLQQ
jgi:DNA-binding SARP family transcriptional activator